MPIDLIVVKATRDEEARVWFVEHSDLPGLNIEAETLDGLMEKLPGAIRDLIEEGALGENQGGVEREVPIELIAHASTRLRIPARS